MDSTSNQYLGTIPDKRIIRALRAVFDRLTASPEEIGRVCDSSARIVITTATALSLTQAEHAGRVVLVNTNSTVANTFTLPAATGTGDKYTLINNVVQTQGSVVFAAAGTDVVKGVCIAAHNTTTTGGGSFNTTATSDKVTLNRTTTGGLGGDMFEAWDSASGTWTVKVLINGNGTLATPFSAT